MHNGRLLTVVVPCYNEEAVIHETQRRLSRVLQGLPDLDYEILYVNDGSRDQTGEILREFAEADRHVRVLDFSRNFGHQIAVTAGIEHAAGDAVVLIDADLQDPPDMIEEMVHRWREGYDVAYGVRVDRDGESRFKRWSATAFYRLMARLTETEIPLDTGDFRLMDRKVVQALAAMPERDRFVRGLVSWTGFRQIAVPYRRAARFAGTSKYPVAKMVRFAMDGIASFSVKPLTATMYVGFAVAALAVVGIIYALILRLFTNIHVPGWTALFIAVLFLGGVQLISLGIMGEYVGRIYGEAKRRPLYLLQDRLGFERPVSAPALVPKEVLRERRVGERRRRDVGWRRSGESLSAQNA